MVKVTVPLRSSWLTSCTYDDATRTSDLDVTMAGGRTYTSYAVPQRVIEDFISSPSPGTYYNDNIKGSYG
jgi:KTSC domain-containing protein